MKELSQPAPKIPSAAVRGLGHLVKMLSGRVAILVVVGVSTLVIARFLGAAAYGRYAAVLAVISIVQVLSYAGLPMVETRFLAPLWATGRQEEAIRLGSSIWTARGIFSWIAAACVCVWLLLSPELELGLGARGFSFLFLFCVLRYVFESTRSLLLPTGHAGKLILFDFLRSVLILPVVLIAFHKSGFAGIFSALAILYVPLVAGALWTLLRILPLQLFRLHWRVLSPYLGYSIATFVAGVSEILQAQIGIYAVANWATATQAGYLAVTVQFYLLAQGFILTSHRALHPLLAELEASGQEAQLGHWAGLMLRYSAALAAVAACAWACFGDEFILLTLTESYAPVSWYVLSILVAVAGYACGSACNTILFVRRREWIAVGNNLLFVGLIALGLFWVMASGQDQVAHLVSLMYALAAWIYFAVCCVTLGLSTGLWLPWARTVGLASPLALGWPLAVRLEGSSWGVQGGVLVALLATYGLLAAALRWLPLDEIRRLVGKVLGRL